MFKLEWDFIKFSVLYGDVVVDDDVLANKDEEDANGDVVVDVDGVTNKDDFFLNLFGVTNPAFLELNMEIL